MSHLKLSETFKIIELILNGIKNKEIKRVTGIVNGTLNDIKKNFKKELRKMYYSENIKIGGEGIICEADKSKFGKRKYNCGHFVDGVWVLGIVERSPARKLLLFIVKKRNKKTIDNIFKKYVYTNTIIYTDKWRGYNNLNWLGYNRYTVNHSIHFVDPESDVHTNTIEGNWCSIKESIPKRYRT